MVAAPGSFFWQGSSDRTEADRSCSSGAAMVAALAALWRRQESGQQCVAFESSIDVHDSDIGGTTVQHSQQGGKATEAGAEPTLVGHGHHRAVDVARQRTLGKRFLASNHDDGISTSQLLDVHGQAMRAGDTDIVNHLLRHPSIPLFHGLVLQRANRCAGRDRRSLFRCRLRCPMVRVRGETYVRRSCRILEGTARTIPDLWVHPHA